MFKRKPRFVRVRLEVLGAKEFPWDGWYLPAALPFLVSDILRGRPDDVASVIVSTLSRAEAEKAGYAYADQLPEERDPKWTL